MRKEPTQRALQGIQTKQKIFETAISMILQHGYDNVSIDEIVHSCNLSKGSFYHHFKSKQDIILHYNNEKFNELMDSFIANPSYKTSKAKCIIDLCNHLLHQWIKFGLDCCRNYLRGCIDEYEVLNSEEPGYKFFEKLLTEGINSGEFNRDTDIRKVIDNLYSINFGSLFMWVSCKSTFDALEIAKCRIGALMEEITCKSH